MRTCVAVPTGESKDYSLLDLISAFNRIPDKDVEVVFAVTVSPTREDKRFLRRVRYAAKLLKHPYQVLECKVSTIQAGEPWRKVTMNRQLLRSVFLDGDYERMLLVGGDNPPSSDVLTILSNLGVDCALGVSYQRPSQSAITGLPIPMLYIPVWTPKDVYAACPDLEPENRRQVELIYKQRTFLQPVYSIPDWDKDAVLYGCVGGDGNGLYSRRLLEVVGWVYPENCGHSEDIHLQMVALSMGFTTAALTHHRVRHIDLDGKEY